MALPNPPCGSRPCWATHRYHCSSSRCCLPMKKKKVKSVQVQNQNSPTRENAGTSRKRKQTTQSRRPPLQKKHQQRESERERNDAREPISSRNGQQKSAPPWWIFGWCSARTRFGKRILPAEKHFPGQIFTLLTITTAPFIIYGRNGPLLCTFANVSEHFDARLKKAEPPPWAKFSPLEKVTAALTKRGRAVIIVINSTGAGLSKWLSELCTLIAKCCMYD